MERKFDMKYLSYAGIAVLRHLLLILCGGVFCLNFDPYMFQ